MFCIRLIIYTILITLA